MLKPSIRSIAARNAVTPTQVREVATDILRALHRNAVTDPRGLTSALLESRFAFGEEAAYHLAALFDIDRRMHDADIPWTETLSRIVHNHRVYDAVVEKWVRFASEAGPTEPAS